jgi:hypothetical protein
MPEAFECHAKRKSRNASKRNSNLNAKRAAAAAGALHVGVVELEAGAFDRLDVVDLDAFEVHRTHLIHGNLQAVKVEYFIGIVGLVLKRHVVLETRAAATNDGNAQRHRCGALHVHDFLYLGAGNGRQIDHKFLGLRSQAHLRCLRLIQYSKTSSLLHNDQFLRLVSGRQQCLSSRFDKAKRFAYNKMQP